MSDVIKLHSGSGRMKKLFCDIEGERDGKV